MGPPFSLDADFINQRKKQVANLQNGEAHESRPAANRSPQFQKNAETLPPPGEVRKKWPPGEIRKREQSEGELTRITPDRGNREREFPL